MTAHHQTLDIDGQSVRLVPGLGPDGRGEVGNLARVIAARRGAGRRDDPDCALKLARRFVDDPARQAQANQALRQEMSVLQGFTALPEPQRRHVPVLLAASDRAMTVDGMALPGIVVEWLGDSLATQLERPPPGLASRTGLAALGLALARALAALALLPGHPAHRDLRCDNILFSRTRGVWVLADYGAAGYDHGDRATLIGGGSEYERPPELRLAAQDSHGAKGCRPVDPRPGDIWGLGLTLYRTALLLGGQRDALPRACYAAQSLDGSTVLARDEQARLRATLGRLPAGADLVAVETLAGLIESCLARDPRRRPAAADLAAAFATLPEPAAARPHRRSRAGLAALLLAAAAAPAGAGWALAPAPALPSSTLATASGSLVARWSGRPGDLPRPLTRRDDGVAPLPAGDRLVVSLRLAPRTTLFGLLPDEPSFVLIDPAGVAHALDWPLCGRQRRPEGTAFECVVTAGGGGIWRLQARLARRWPPLEPHLLLDQPFITAERRS